MLQQEGKYLYFADDVVGGQDDQVRALELMIIAALSLQRIPIVKETETAYQHRTSVRYIPFRWDSYIDLARTKIAEIRPDGTVKEVQSSLRWVYEKDFNFKMYGDEQIRNINLSQLYEQAYVHTPILCAKGNVSIRSYYKILHQITLFPSRKVDDLTDIVLARFGTNRKSSLYAQASLSSKTQPRPYDFKFNYYICMHIRTRDIVLLDKSYYFAMQKEQINHIVKTVCKRHTRKIPVYIMSDLEPDYFDFLKPEYNIYTYADFPKLKELFASKYAPVDHNLLYAVEKNIMRHALVKIMPPDRNKLVFDASASYDIPPNISANYDSAKIRQKERRITTFIHRVENLLRRYLKKKPEISGNTN